MTRISPRRYSAVTNIAATIAKITSATNTPPSVCASVAPIPDGPYVTGAMSPDPVIVKSPPSREYPVAGPP